MLYYREHEKAVHVLERNKGINIIIVFLYSSMYVRIVSLKLICFVVKSRVRTRSKSSVTACTHSHVK